MSTIRDAKAPLRILIRALGGEEGGVLVSWIVAAARAAGYGVQATSVPGVAQRTGSTSYYVEIAEDGAAPVFSLMPMPGRADVVLAGEPVEAARVMKGGFVSPGLTTLIASTSRVYSTAERIAMGDGRFDEEAIRTAAGTLAKTAHLLDLQALATQHGTFVSAILFGALAGSGALPWPVEISKGVLGTGRSAEASLGGYAALYAERVGALLAGADLRDPQALHAVTEASRRLALWMACEDVARVADLKKRGVDASGASGRRAGCSRARSCA